MEAATNGALYPHGDATPMGSTVGMSLTQPVVGAALSVLSSGSGSGSSSPQGQMAAPAGYTSSQMTLDDTFSGGSVNSSNWNTEVDPGIGTGTTQDLAQRLLRRRQDQRKRRTSHPSQASVDNGLTLTARQTTSSDIGYSKGFDWVSGAVTSKNPLPSTGWYVQIRAEMPDSSDGMWPALWFLPASSAQEFDGFEGGWTGSSPNEQGHSDLFASSGQQQDVWSTGGAALNAGYNTYGFQYIPGQSVTAYLNGKQVYQASGSVASEAYYLIIELQVASSSTSGWHTSLSSSTPNPSTMNIAEVQIYS